MTDTAPQAELLLEHAEFVRRLARGLVRDPDRADDVVQETWLAALENPPRARESAAAWFRSAARNIASKLDRGERRRVRRETVVASTEPVAPDAGELVHRLALQRAAVDAVLSLTEPTRTAIVLRYFEDLSPTEIAARLGVPRNTVRARLRRGLERLRADLDARHDGDRTRWLAAMLPLAGIEPATLAAGAAAGTIGTLGAWTMAAKSLSSVAAATVFSWVAWTLVAPPADGPEPETRRVATAPALGPALAGIPSSEVAAAEASPAPAREVAEDTTDAAAGEDAPLPAAGVVVFRPYDARTGRRPPTAIDTRFLNDRRFGELETDAATDERTDASHDGTVTASLTSGSWEGSIRCAGYEDTTLRSFDVRPGRTTDLGWVRMEPGAARITGRVRTVRPPGTDDPEIVVELRGAGRGPCARCSPRREDGTPDLVAARSRETPCESCGFQEERSRLPIRADGEFSFGALASGTYRLTVRRDGEDLGIDRLVTLERGREAWVDLSLLPSAVARFDLVGEDGRPFLRESSEPGRAIVQTVQFEFRREGEPFAEARYVHSSAPLTTESVLPSRQLLLAATQVQWSYVTALQTLPIDRTFLPVPPGLELLIARSADHRLDRRRREGDVLRPARGAPERPVAKLGARRPEERGPIEVSPLPREPHEVVVVSGRFASEPVRLDLGFGRATRHRIVMRARAEEEEEEGAPTELQDIGVDFAASGTTVTSSALELRSSAPGELRPAGRSLEARYLARQAAWIDLASDEPDEEEGPDDDG